MSEGMRMLIGYGVLTFCAGHVIGMAWSAVSSLIKGVTGSSKED